MLEEAGSLRLRERYQEDGATGGMTAAVFEEE